MSLAALRPWWEQGAGWWGDRSARERLLLTILGVVALAALLLILVVRPLEAVRADARAHIRADALLTARLQAAPHPAHTHAGTPAAIVAASAAAAAVSVEQVDPEGGGVRVVLAEAPFPQVLRFLVEAEHGGGLRLREARIERGVAPGAVTARFLLGA